MRIDFSYRKFGHKKTTAGTRRTCGGRGGTRHAVRGWTGGVAGQVVNILEELVQAKAAANLIKIRGGKNITAEPRMTYPMVTGERPHKPGIPGEFLIQRRSQDSPEWGRAQGGEGTFFEKFLVGKEVPRGCGKGLVLAEMWKIFP
ncbi:MAG: hypothetical protein CMO66_01970 [Verrucomicrobiales bacterium]|nr:hypothetical protein [Verrucomicrobiales bacterium]